MKFMERAFGQPIEILKFNDFKGAPCMVSATGVTADENNLKIVKAGTPWPANDATCKGILLHDVDVSHGDAPGTYVFEGSIDSTKLAQNGTTVTGEAKTAIPRVTFFE